MEFHSPLLITTIFVALSLTTAVARGTPHDHGASKCEAVLDPKLGRHSMAITTSSDLARKYFDQGLLWAYGFNHEAAERSFRKAAALDPSCAMCHWGVAYVLGPNINHPMPAEAAAPAFEAIQKAEALAAGVTERERDYISAMAKRYTARPPSDRSALDRAYAAAMGEVYRRHSDDRDAAAIYAEAMMDLMPWDYWKKDKSPRETTKVVLQVLETTLKAAPLHPGANHFYIHVVESVHPQRGEGAADRLRALELGAGHLVHMPSHIYIRVGRYDDAIASNLKGIAADGRYLASCPTTGFYAMMYVPHNVEFLVAAAGLDGRRGLALQGAMALRRFVAPQLARGMTDTEQFWMTPLLVKVRFGQWGDVLAWPEPEAKYAYARGLWRFSRAMAYVRLGRFEAARREIESLEQIAATPSLEKALIMGLNPASRILAIGVQEARGELKAAQRDYGGAITHLTEAVKRQDALRYIEPPPWHHSVRLALGTVLVEAGRGTEAEAVFRAELERFPKNGWALFGLAQSLELQGRREAASGIRRQFGEAWRRADVMLKAARF